MGKHPGKKGLKRAAAVLSVVLAVMLCYCVVIFTDWIPPLSYLRQMYIETAMSTMTHQWLATAFIPGDIVQEVVDGMKSAQEAQVGVNSQWEEPEQTEPVTVPLDPEAAFFGLFYELEESSVRDFAAEHPEAIALGWENFYVNEAGMEDEGTAMVTTRGDQVLAVDAANGLLVVRVTGSTYRGVLVIGKDPSRLTCAAASNWGTAGETAGMIAENNNGLAAITGSGFVDDPYSVDGATQSGGAMCGGVEYGTHYDRGYKRIELHTDNRLYVVDAHTDYSPDCTDATEWTPALIVDGVSVVSEADGYTSLNPRACLGQTKDGSILMLGIEGRYAGSWGCNAQECARILAGYGAYQAMNLDGGTSAMVWYQGECIMRCSDITMPEGRDMPNAWIYCASTVPDP